MSRPFALLVIPFLCVLGLKAQSQTPPPMPDRVRRQDRDQNQKVESDMEQRMRSMATVDDRLRRMPSGPRYPSQLTKEQKELIEEMRRVDEATLAQYEAFLRRPRTGIVKLFPDTGCRTEYVIRADNECSGIYAYSSSYTFYDRSYAGLEFYDILFEPDRIKSGGFFSQGIAVDLGNIAIETVELTDPNLKYLAEFQPAMEPNAAIEQKKKFEKGVTVGGLNYSQSVIPKPDTTYAIRIIAYRLSNALKPDGFHATKTEAEFLSLNFVKRLDSLVAFRVVKQDENGAITVVWEELSRTRAPSLKFPKGQPLTDLKPSS